MATAKKSAPAKKATPAKKSVAVKKPAVAKKTVAAKPVKSSKSVKPGKPPVVKWGPQKFVVIHVKEADFITGLRSYAKYRDLGMTEATSGAVQAHVIRLLGPCDPKVVAIPHYHGVQFQMLYMLKGWMIGEYEGQGKIKMKAGSCWLQPNGRNYFAWQV